MNLRIFLTYSHEDKQQAKELVNHLLEECKVYVTWDEEFFGGMKFPEQIAEHIAHAHVVVALLTENTDDRPWVQHEIACARALNIPVLPVAINTVPRGLIETTHAIVRDSIKAVKERLTAEMLREVSRDPDVSGPPLYECAIDARTRARMFAKYCRKAYYLDAAVGGACGDKERHPGGMLRQRGALGVFSIPNVSCDNDIWRRRYPKDNRGSDEGYINDLLEERRQLERHVLSAGCRLIINYGVDYDRKFRPGARRTRLEILRDALEEFRDKKIDAKVILLEKSILKSTTLVGDWFMAEAIAGDTKRGYRYTLFTKHGPTVAREAEDFDRTFSRLEKRFMEGASGRSSLEISIEKLNDRIEKLPPGNVEPATVVLE